MYCNVFTIILLFHYYYYYYYIYAEYLHNIPKPNHVSMVHSVPGALCLQFWLHVTLLRPRTMCYTSTLALSELCVQ
jgi:hypothetical protein